MTQDQIDLAVAKVTGEPLAIVRQRGFDIADPNDADYFDCEVDVREPFVLDWDSYYAACWIEPVAHFNAVI